MAYLNELIARFQELNFELLVERVVENTEEGIADRQREQLLHGETSTGAPIGTYRSPGYAQAKHTMNPLPGLGYVDLRKTGAFYRGIYAAVVGDELIIDSSDGKTPDLIAKYGEDIFGLNGEFRRRYVSDELKPALFKQIQAVTGLPFGTR